MVVVQLDNFLIAFSPIAWRCTVRLAIRKALVKADIPGVNSGEAIIVFGQEYQNDEIREAKNPRTVVVFINLDEDTTPEQRACLADLVGKAVLENHDTEWQVKILFK